MTKPDFPRKTAGELPTKKGAIGGLSPAEAGHLLEPWVKPKAQVGGGGGGGGVTTRLLTVTWSGLVPPSDGQGQIFEIPYKPDGSSYSFVVTRAVARMEAVFSSDQGFLLQKAGGGDVAFASPTTIATLTVLAGHYRAVNSSLAFTLVSGDLVGLFFTPAASLVPFMIEMVGST